ncbi:MAG TPA: DUF1295 domain-containing protein, partial [Aggregatilineales bacterium]|nr:DUF1295 domain-containing protein [Aggregatilineales bacterium]
MSFIEIYLIGLAMILGFTTALWIVSLMVRDSSIIDPFWGILFLLSGVAYFLLSDDGFETRKILMITLVTIWSLRLSGYLA